MKTTAEILRAAADHIDEVGLAKGRYYRGSPEDVDVRKAFNATGGSGACCTIGAVYFVARDHDRLARVLRELTSLLSLASQWELPDWNDKPSQRKSRVVAALRRAAHKAAA